MFYGRDQEKKDADVAEQYVEKRLHDYGYAKWASAEPDIWFVVYGEEKDDKYQDIPRGIMTLGEERIPFVIHFDKEKGVRFQISDGESFSVSEASKDDREKEFFDDVPDLIVGECSFETDKLIVQVDEKDGVFFKGKVLEFSGILFP